MSWCTGVAKSRFVPVLSGIVIFGAGLAKFGLAWRGCAAFCPGRVRVMLCEVKFCEVMVEFCVAGSRYGMEKHRHVEVWRGLITSGDGVVLFG